MFTNSQEDSTVQDSLRHFAEPVWADENKRKPKQQFHMICLSWSILIWQIASSGLTQTGGTARWFRYVLWWGHGDSHGSERSGMGPHSPPVCSSSTGLQHLSTKMGDFPCCSETSLITVSATSCASAPGFGSRDINIALVWQGLTQWCRCNIFWRGNLLCLRCVFFFFFFEVSKLLLKLCLSKYCNDLLSVATWSGTLHTLICNTEGYRLHALSLYCTDHVPKRNRYILVPYYAAM